MDFIGIGAQRSGTSWIYACLYEHPEICAPIKELHFFSRDRYQSGISWYEAHFDACAHDALKGEFSTSYLVTPETPARIHADYPNVKIIMSLRNPIDRAFSQYRNAIKAGEIEKNMLFEDYLTHEPSVREQGLYAEQLKRYRNLFPVNQLLVLVYEDSLSDPASFIQSLYAFLGVDTGFVPSLLTRRVNTARTPKAVGIDRVMIRSAEWLRQNGLDRLVWLVKKSGIPRLIRRANTEHDSRTMDPATRRQLAAYFHDDVERLSELIGRDLNTYWQL